MRPARRRKQRPRHTRTLFRLGGRPANADLTQGWLLADDALQAHATLLSRRPDTRETGRTIPSLVIANARPASFHGRACVTDIDYDFSSGSRPTLERRGDNHACVRACEVCVEFTRAAAQLVESGEVFPLFLLFNGAATLWSGASPWHLWRRSAALRKTKTNAAALELLQETAQSNESFENTIRLR